LPILHVALLDFCLKMPGGGSVDNRIQRQESHF